MLEPEKEDWKDWHEKVLILVEFEPRPFTAWMLLFGQLFSQARI